MRLERSVRKPRRRWGPLLALALLVLLIVAFVQLRRKPLISLRAPPESMARLDLTSYVVAYLQWTRASGPGSFCPASIRALTAHAPDVPPTDPWGQPYTMDCSLAGDAFVVSSGGPDQTHRTPDDISERLPLFIGGRLGSVGDSPWIPPRGMDPERNPWRRSR